MPYIILLETVLSFLINEGKDKRKEKKRKEKKRKEKKRKERSPFFKKLIFGENIEYLLYFL